MLNRKFLVKIIYTLRVSFCRHWCVFFAIARCKWLEDKRIYLERLRNGGVGDADRYKRMGRQHRITKGLFDDFADAEGWTKEQRDGFVGVTRDMLPRVERFFGVKIDIYHRPAIDAPPSETMPIGMRCY